MIKNINTNYHTGEIHLKAANKSNIDYLINITLNPVSQGEYKIVPNMNRAELCNLFLNDNNRQYFMIVDSEGIPIGRFYIRKWIFNKTDEKIDWELNIIIGNPDARGKGYGTQVQKLAIEVLSELEETNSIFAYTMKNNIGERRALEKCSFRNIGDMNNDYYKVDLGELNPSKFVLYALQVN